MINKGNNMKNPRLLWATPQYNTPIINPIKKALIIAVDFIFSIYTSRIFMAICATW